MTVLHVERPKPYRRTPTGKRMCDCPSGPCQRVAEEGGRCVECARFCRAREGE